LPSSCTDTFLPPSTTTNIHRLSTSPSPTESSRINHYLAKWCAKEGPPRCLDVDQLLFVADFPSYFNITTQPRTFNSTPCAPTTTVRITNRSFDLTSKSRRNFRSCCAYRSSRNTSSTAILLHPSTLTTTIKLQLHHDAIMEVDHEHFRKELLPILRSIANADFITIDLEMSGISIRPKFSSGDRSHNVGKPTLEQQYQELKSAAEAFQVLQIGITCVEVDREKGELSFFLSSIHSLVLCIRRKPRESTLSNIHLASTTCIQGHKEVFSEFLSICSSWMFHLKR
jgi:hypothetical protein